MTLGYDGKLYILAFDHRGSFQKKMFGIEGDPSEEQTATISDAKHLIFEGMLKAVDRGAEPGVTGVLVDEQFGAPKNIPGDPWRAVPNYNGYQPDAGGNLVYTEPNYLDVDKPFVTIPPEYIAGDPRPPRLAGQRDRMSGQLRPPAAR